MEEKKNYQEIVDIEVKNRIAVKSTDSIETFGNEDQGFQCAGFDGITSKSARQAIASGEITSSNKQDKLEILLCICTLEDDSTKEIPFLSLKRKANRTL